MELNAATKIDDLLREYPFLMDFFIARSPKYKLLQNTIMRKTVGRVATLHQVALIGGIETGQLLDEVAIEIRARNGEVVVNKDTVGSTQEPIDDEQIRQELLKDIIRDLHKGVDMTILKRRFFELIKDIDPSEIAKMEQRLIEEGMPESEIKRLCDVHVEVFKESLGQKEVPSVPAGHPVHTFMQENREAERVMQEIAAVLEKVCDSTDRERFGQYQKDLEKAIEKLSDVNLHYLRKENQLFPVLEKHGFSGPSEVMWAIHDDIRKLLKSAGRQIAERQVPGVYETIRSLLQSMRDMVYKEEHILFPASMEMLTDGEWGKVRRGEEEIGYAWISPGKEWGAESVSAAAEGKGQDEAMGLDTGRLTLEQINLILTNLPVDLSFVNEKDEVMYYSQTKERIFPRSPGVIGRKVQNCHPPKSMHMVQKILDEFRAGRRDVGEFWIQMKGRFLHIRYFAVRDSQGAYRGTLEVSQDVSGIKKLEGMKRLLDWE